MKMTLPGFHAHTAQVVLLLLSQHCQTYARELLYYTTEGEPAHAAVPSLPSTPTPSHASAPALLSKPL